MSIKKLLQQRSKELNMAMPKLLQHYAMERFLYRLSLSPVSDKFFLKGGMLLMGIGAGVARTTMDIDLLGRLSNSPENIQKSIRQIIHTKPGIEDGVSFDDTLSVYEITKDALYVGLRVEFVAHVVGERCNMKVDIGFSDEIYPQALSLEYPPTLPSLPSAKLLCYSTESIVAEKWQAMVQLKTMNSRMKDFYDLWFLSQTQSFDYIVLKEAINRTFQRRQTDPSEYTSLLTDSYVKTQQPEWAAYIRKLKATTFQNKEPLALPSRYLSDVLSDILKWLEPVMLNNTTYHRWTPNKGWK